MILAKNISKQFGEQVLLTNLNFEITKGDKVCITADSGKGKTTLLKILLGLENFENGSITISGKELNNNNIVAIREQIAWLPQELNIQLSKGYELIEMLNLDEGKFHSFLKKLNLEATLLNQDFKSISGGQKQRMLLAACFSLEKPILILDEPTSALDKNSIQLLINTINEIKDLTIISVSHNADWINFCNKKINL